MATIVNRRRGTSAEHAAFTGAVGETTYNTDVKILVAHDGATVGGFPAAHLHVANIFSQPQTIAVLSGAPTIAFDVQVDALSRFQVRKSGFIAALRQEADVSPSSFELSKRGTTGNALAALSNGSAIGALLTRGYDGTAFGDAGSIFTVTTQAWAVGAHGTQLVFRTVPAGSATETTHATLNSTELSVTSRLLLPNTTSATVGGIYFGGNRAFHNFGTNNTFAGVNAGNFTMTGIDNVVLGFQAFGSNTTGNDNLAVGVNSLSANTTGNQNVSIGSDSLFNNISGNNNVGLGFQTLRSNLTGVSNLAIGTNSLFSNTSGSLNVGVGINSLTGNTTGIRNVGVGPDTLMSNISGGQNTAIGSGALSSNTASYNVAVGIDALVLNTSGSLNVGIGANAIQSNLTGSNNTGIGTNVFILATGSNNIGLGYQAGNNLTTGSNNIVLGYDIDSPTATNSNTLTIGNLIFGTGVDGTGTTISSGLVGIKVITPETELHVVSTSASDPRGIMSAQHTTDAVGARIHFRKSRGTATAPTTVVTGDVLGRLRFSGYDSANYLQMGSIDVVSVGTIAATRVPTFMAFSTATDATPSVLTERLRIDQAGKIQILTGVGNDAGGFKHARVTTGSVGAGSTALVTITWTTAFADTNYTVNASVLEATTSSLSMSVVHIESITAAAVTVRVLNNAVGSLTGTVHVIAVHD